MTDLFLKSKSNRTSCHLQHEAPVRDYSQTDHPHVDEVVHRRLGKYFWGMPLRRADAPRIMVAGHMDEVGFGGREIKADGTFRVVEIAVGTLWWSAANVSPF